MITDRNLADAYGVENIHGLKYYVLENPGEWNKSIETASKIVTHMISIGCDRQTIVIPFGGGVVGDLGGFVASIFLRGVRYVHIPTSIIAMSDSSIGGKVGVDSPLGKNLIGAIYNPCLILTNMNFLKTLDDRNFSNGMVEVIKMGAINDKDLFANLENTNIKELWEDIPLLTELITVSIKGKARIVEEDIREKGLWKILNFGHTIGHAIEAHENGKMLHGEAVAIGMNIEL